MRVLVSDHKGRLLLRIYSARHLKMLFVTAFQSKNKMKPKQAMRQYLLELEQMFQSKFYFFLTNFSHKPQKSHNAFYPSTSRFYALIHSHLTFYCIHKISNLKRLSNVRW